MAKKNALESLSDAELEQELARRKEKRELQEIVGLFKRQDLIKNNIDVFLELVNKDTSSTSPNAILKEVKKDGQFFGAYDMGIELFYRQDMEELWQKHHSDWVNGNFPPKE